MAKLVKCKDCGQEISKRAKACPHCGRPQKKTSGCAWLVLIGIIFFVGMSIFSASSSKKPSRQRPPRQTIAPVPTAKSTPNPAPKPTSIPQPTATPDIRHGRTEQQRKLIMKEIFDAETRGMREAEEQYPLLKLTAQNSENFAELEMKQTKLRLELMEKLNEQYRQEVLKKYNVTDGELQDLEVETFEKDWFTTFQQQN